MDTRFHCVYLLTSLDPRWSGIYYIGYTVNPLRRLRQHNGELVSGAKQTMRRGRPWTLVCCVSGFSEARVALRFEWCWQHPKVSSAGPRRLPFAIRILHELLRESAFARQELTLHIFEADRFYQSCSIGAAPGSSQGGTPHATAMTPVTSPTTLPVFEPSALFHVEEVTRQAFEAKYLAPEHDGGGGGGGGDASLDGSYTCPYDLLALSQVVAEGFASTDTRADGEGCDRSPVRVASSQRAHSGSASAFDEEAWGGGEGGGDGIHTDSTRAASLPVGDPVMEADTILAAAMPPGAVDRGTDGLPVPLRFKYYQAADFVADYEAEQRQLEAHATPCTLCGLPLEPPYITRCPRTPFCSLATHMVCLAMWMQRYGTGEQSQSAETSTADLGGASGCAGAEEALPAGSCSAGVVRLVPRGSCPCPLCACAMHWGVLVRELKHRAIAQERWRARERRRRMEQRLAERLCNAAGGRGSGLVARRRRQARSLSPRVEVRLGEAGGAQRRPRRARVEAGPEGPGTSLSQPVFSFASGSGGGGSTLIDRVADELIFS